MLRTVIFIIISLITFFILLINIRLYSDHDSLPEKKTDIVHQLNFLEDELKNNSLGDKMQRIFPEGFVFVNALYGLSWCELALCDSNDQSLHIKAIRESLYAFNAINSEKAKSTFDQSLKPGYGIFYNGWRNYLLSKILEVDTGFTNSTFYIKQYQSASDSILQDLNESANPFLESYNGSSWPADMFVTMASISNHDKIFGQKYGEAISKWIRLVRSKLDPKTNMFPHMVDSKSNVTIEAPRGSSMSLMIRMLTEIDPHFAREQYQLFKEKFVATTLGLPSVREFQENQSGQGDVDSGPVIFGVGFTGTIMSIGTFALSGDEDLYDEQYKTVNAFGFPYTWNEQKKYLLGKFPMADAFIAWGRASSLNKATNFTNSKPGWRIKFNLISSSLIAILWITFYRRKIFQKSI